MNKVLTKVEFYQGTKAALFRLVRTPETPLAHLLFIAPLFEQANQTRHHITRSSIHAYHRGIETIIFDHYGTGDSAGELIDASLSLWQQDILKQVADIKSKSDKAIYLSIPLSAALLLSNEIIEQIDAIMFLQPEFNGKRFTQQFKRLALAAELTKDKKSQLLAGNIIEIAGYQVEQQLLDDLAKQDLNQFGGFNKECYWFEWQGRLDKISAGRLKQQQALAGKNNKLTISHIDDIKFWQATELQVAPAYLTQEKLTFVQLLAMREA